MPTVSAIHPIASSPMIILRAQALGPSAALCPGPAIPGRSVPMMISWTTAAETVTSSSKLAGLIPPERLTGYDPVPDMVAAASEALGGRATILSSAAELADGRFTRMACLDTLEHLTEGDLSAVLKDSGAS